MKRVTRLNWLHLVLLFVMIPFNSLHAEQRSQEPDSEEAFMVGRISYLEGRVLRYVPEKDDWVAAVKDAPFGMDDALRSDEHGRAEFIMPNNTWIRIDGDTQIQIIVLKEDITGIDVVSGIARFYNKGSNATIKVTTPFGYVTAPKGTCFDLYVGHGSVEVISLKGKVEFVQLPDEKKFEVIAGSLSIVADSRQTTAGEGYGIPDWKNWNSVRDNIWLKRVERKGESTKYLPPALNHEAWVLDDYGTWVRVYYEGAYRYFWHPVHVGSVSLEAPVGEWALWYGDQCWIPAERFGYVTHHYGNWVLVKGIWYWTPPVVHAKISLGLPFFNIGFAWYPGRVAWIHSGIHIGWVPLAPFEPYYSHRRWGRRSVVVKNVKTMNNIRINKYRYFNRAVIINRDNPKTRRRVQVVSQRNIKTKNIEHPKGQRIKPLPASGGIKKRSDFKNVKPAHKPNRIVTERIHHNKLQAKMGLGVSAKTVRKISKNIGHSNPVKGRRMGNLKVKSRLVPPDQVTRPVSKVNFRAKDM